MAEESGVFEVLHPQKEQQQEEMSLTHDRPHGRGHCIDGEHNDILTDVMIGRIALTSAWPGVLTTSPLDRMGRGKNCYKLSKNREKPLCKLYWSTSEKSCKKL